MLLANNFHFENNCAILSIEGYPPNVFETVRAMLKPYDAGLMKAYAVSRTVNSVKNDTEECIAPVADEPELGVKGEPLL